MNLPSPPTDYTPFEPSSLRAWLADRPQLAERVGGPAEAWTIVEVGDGNLNLVFLVTGSGPGLCVKQALPYVRLVGPEWPLPADRAWYEQACMAEHGRHVGHLLPELIHYQPELYCIVMERLSPHIIMRHGLIAGTRYPGFAEAIATYLARSLFFTSDLAVPAAEKRALVGRFANNVALCKITEDLVFTDPYRPHKLNRWTSPELDGEKAAFEADLPAKLAAQRLKAKFLGQAQALLHGDLHTGSVMVTATDTRVIDPEFALMGPIGFDVGAVLANLLIAFMAQRGHEDPAEPRDGYRDWLAATIEAVWAGFAQQFLALWRTDARGDLYPQALFQDELGQAALEAERHRFMAGLFTDTLGFAGAKMVRRILGLAHTIDLDRIEPPARRAACERLCLRLARELLVAPERFADIAAVVALARSIDAEPA